MSFTVRHTYLKDSSPWCPLDRTPLRLKSRPWFFGEEKNLWPISKIKAQFPNCNLITKLAMFAHQFFFSCILLVCVFTGDCMVVSANSEIMGLCNKMKLHMTWQFTWEIQWQEMSCAHSWCQSLWGSVFEIYCRSVKCTGEINIFFESVLGTKQYSFINYCFFSPDIVPENRNTQCHIKENCNLHTVVTVLYHS